MAKNKRKLTTEDMENITRTVSEVLDASKMNNLKEMLSRFLNSRDDLSIGEQKTIIDDLQSQPVYRAYEMLDRISDLLMSEVLHFASAEDMEEQKRILERTIEEFKAEPAYKDIMEVISGLNDVHSAELVRFLRGIFERYSNTCATISELKPMKKEERLINEIKKRLDIFEERVEMTNDVLNNFDKMVSIIAPDTGGFFDKIINNLEEIKCVNEDINNINKLKLNDREKYTLGQLKYKAENIKEKFIEIQSKLLEIEADVLVKELNKNICELEKMDILEEFNNGRLKLENLRKRGNASNDQTMEAQEQTAEAQPMQERFTKFEKESEDRAREKEENTEDENRKGKAKGNDLDSRG